MQRVTGRGGPVRMCIGCRGRADKVELVRLVRSGDAVLADPGANRPGRGAYLHPRAECLTQAVRKRAVGRALRVSGLGPVDLTVVLAGCTWTGAEAAEATGVNR